jgi:phage FluMu protein Com
MSSLSEIRCPACHRKLCEAAGTATLQLPCRHCRLLVTAILTPVRVRIMAAA